MNTVPRISDSEVTPWSVYLNRRQFLRGAALAASVATTATIYRSLNGTTGQLAATPELMGLVKLPEKPSGQDLNGFRVNEPLTTERDITHYNNFYEFTTQKEGVAAAAAGFRTTGWQIGVSGLVRKPRTFSWDEFRRISPPEERIYRMRCVEAWSMVIPWAGIPLARLLERVEPTAEAKYVAFETLYDPQRMPGQKTAVLDWPYVEGLRLDEAMHPLTLLATGLYGRELPPQDGAPVRLVVPWKYGFKGIKSIVKISLVSSQPSTSWSRHLPNEYGFFANVNPNVDHPRWSQATEQRIGEFGRRQTLMFNGYQEQVADLYAGMDLQSNY
jgi:sulfoxide reductase catalytic subunit YedY